MGARFSQSELRKAIDVAHEKGLSVERFIIRPDGSIEVDMAQPKLGAGLDDFDLANLRR